MDQNVSGTRSGKKSVQEETERTQEEGSVHIQVTDGKDKTENQRSVHT
jgi:hypothetical protein